MKAQVNWDPAEVVYVVKSNFFCSLSSVFESLPFLSDDPPPPSPNVSLQ